MIKLIQLTIVLLIPFIAKSQDYCDFIQNVQNYQDSVELKQVGDSDILDSETFDVRTYTSLLTIEKTKMKKKLELLLYDNFLDGNPIYMHLTDGGILKHKIKSLYDKFNKTEIKHESHIPKYSERVSSISVFL
jgi:hypothetical protein